MRKRADSLSLLVRSEMGMDPMEKSIFIFCGRISEGMELGLENDVVIFNALRNGHINGESERQEEKMREYFFKKSIDGLYLKHEGDEEK